MKKYFTKILFINLSLFALTFVFSCGTINKNKKIAERYSCRNYDFSVALVEIVDTETNGEISGGTRFHSKTGNEIFYSYQRYNSGRDALNRLKQEPKEADKILEETELMNGGKVIGKKIVFYAEKKTSFGIDKNYYLLWTKESVLTEDSLFYWIRSKSLAGIEEMEKECKF